MVRALVIKLISVRCLFVINDDTALAVCVVCAGDLAADDGVQALTVIATTSYHQA